MPSAAVAPVVPHAAEAVAPGVKGFTAAKSAPTRAGWIIQIGAFDIEPEARRQLSSAHAKAGQMLDNADPFTEVVVKGDKTLYRARFAGFRQKDEAEAACKQLKLRDIDCISAIVQLPTAPNLPPQPGVSIIRAAPHPPPSHVATGS